MDPLSSAIRSQMTLILWKGGRCWRFEQEKKKKMVWKTVMLKSEGSSEPGEITRQNSAGV